MYKFVPIILGLFLLALTASLPFLPIPIVKSWINGINNMAYDQQLKIRLFNSQVITSPIAVVDIDDLSIKRLGRWPWQRSLVAKLITDIQSGGAVVIALDFMLSEPELNLADIVLEKMEQKKILSPSAENKIKEIIPDFDEDKSLAGVLAQGDHVLGFSFLYNGEKSGQLPSPTLVLTGDDKRLHFLTARGYLGTLPLLQLATKNGGFLNVYPDSDGIIRRIPLLIRYQDAIYSSLALEAVRVYLFGKTGLITAAYKNRMELEAIKIGDRIIPTDEKGNALIPFRGKSFTFPYYSAVNVLNKKIPKTAFMGKIVFIGTSATGLGDIRATAIEGEYPGVEIQASIADGILSNNFSYRPHWAIGAEMAFTLVFGLIIVFLFPQLGPLTLFFMIIGIPSLLVYGNNLLWEKTGLIVYVISPIIFTVILAILNILYGYLFETLRRERLKSMFGQYVPKTHIDTMLKSGSDYGLRGEDRDMTVLFADIRNFTAISEFISAMEIKNLLDQFFTPMTKIIFDNKGTIDKYIGDMVMAFWGAPLKDADHARHALEAAVAMKKALIQLNESFVKQGKIKLFFGIGINSGIMSVGDMGSQYRRSYTVLGDAVNLGSRIESLNKLYGTTILTSSSTIQNQTDFLFRQIDKVKVKGKKAAVMLYEVLCKKEEATDELYQEIQLSDQALHFYFGRDFENAKKIFSELHAQFPKKKLYSVFILRITGLIKNPPPENWDGVTAVY